MGGGREGRAGRPRAGRQLVWNCAPPSVASSAPTVITHRGPSPPIHQLGPRMPHAKAGVLEGGMDATLGCPAFHILCPHPPHALS